MMRKICLHWTAGTHARTEADARSYHFTVGPDGAVSAGQFRPEANIPPLRSGQYAAHCGGGNSWCIGVALRGMAGYQGPGRVGKAPVTRLQGEAAWSLTAELCKTYAIPVTPDTVFTHYEFGKRHPGSGSAGKIDIVHLPYAPDVQTADIGDYIRGKVRWYLKHNSVG
jgi:hypothetical protein